MLWDLEFNVGIKKIYAKFECKNSITLSFKVSKFNFNAGFSHKVIFCIV